MMAAEHGLAAGAGASEAATWNTPASLQQLDPQAVGALFQTRAKRLEAHVLRQMQDKKTIEFLQAQLLATSQLVRRSPTWPSVHLDTPSAPSDARSRRSPLATKQVNSLEQHHVAQAQQIEANLRQALQVYEQARVMRQQQNQLSKVVAHLTQDLCKLHAASAAGGPSEPAGTARSGNNSCGTSRSQSSSQSSFSELPTLAELLPQSNPGTPSTPYASHAPGVGGGGGSALGPGPCGSASNGGTSRAPGGANLAQAAPDPQTSAPRQITETALEVTIATGPRSILVRVVPSTARWRPSKTRQKRIRFRHTPRVC